MKTIQWFVLGAAMSVGAAQAASTDVTIHQVSGDGVGDSVGKVTITESEYGLIFTPDLKALPAAFMGFTYMKR